MFTLLFSLIALWLSAGIILTIWVTKDEEESKLLGLIGLIFVAPYYAIRGVIEGIKERTETIEVKDENDEII